MTKTFARTISLVAVPLVALASLSACGAGHEAGSGRPTTDQIVSAFTTGPLKSELPASVTGSSSVLKCIAQKYEDSKISDAGLRALVNGDDNYKPTKADTDAVDGLTSQMADCVK